jgi:hypothetical protein
VNCALFHLFSAVAGRADNNNNNNNKSKNTKKGGTRNKFILTIREEKGELEFIALDRVPH